MQIALLKEAFLEAFYMYMYVEAVSQRTLTMFVGVVALRYQQHTTLSVTN